MPPGIEKTAFARLSEAMLKWHGLAGNEVMTPNVIGSINIVTKETSIVHEMSGGRLPKDHIWVNVVHAVDGAWGIAGAAKTNEQLKDAISKG